MTYQKTSIFSATVGALIIEFYKKLSPDSGDQTVDLLCQVSQQLPNLRNGTCSAPQNDQSFSPSVSMIWVIAMWMISLLLSLMSALFAHYSNNAPDLGMPNELARSRSFLFFGTLRSNVRDVVETAPTLLHCHPIPRRLCCRSYRSSFHPSRLPIQYSVVKLMVVIIPHCPLLIHHSVHSVLRQLYDLPDHLGVDNSSNASSARCGGSPKALSKSTGGLSRMGFGRSL